MLRDRVLVMRFSMHTCLRRRLHLFRCMPELMSPKGRKVTKITPMNAERNFVSVNGIAIGEESKGNSVQSLVRELNAHTVWRSGGWQGGHWITHDDGREMAFSFFGAGTFEGAKTYLKHMVISPGELFQEALELEEKGVPDPFSLIAIDQDCLSSTPFHSAISRMKEILRGENKKGTIGTGVGEAIRDSVDPELTIYAGDFADKAKCSRRADAIRRQKHAVAQILIADHTGPIPPEVYNELAILEDEELVELFASACKYLSGMADITDDRYLTDLLRQKGSIVNEVSHGVLHHPRYGFIPHITHIDPTSSDVVTTIRNHGYQGNICRIGIVRSYLTRHGAGPLVSHNPQLSQTLPETHNDAAHDWLGEFRVGNFDSVALNYALSINKDIKAVDGLMVSFLDVLSNRKEWQVCEAYEYVGQATDLEDYFYLQNGTIIGIKIHPDSGGNEHYQHQLRLTELLRQCRPILTTIRPHNGQKMDDVFISYVESKLGVPVVGKAYGPKVTDRHYLPSFGDIMKSHR